MPGLASLFQGRLAISTVSRRRIIERLQQMGDKLILRGQARLA